MKNKFVAIIASFFLLASMTSLKAEANFGISFIAAQSEVSGSEQENGSADDKNTKTVEETFYGASVFLEGAADNGFAIGIDYVPVDLEIGSGSRTDTDGGHSSGEADTGTRKASADLEDLITLYTNIPFGENGYYGLAGYHFVSVSTSETLPNSSYGNTDINGYQIGFGKRTDTYKAEVFYSDFEDISLTATGGSGSHKIEADADAIGFKLSLLF